VAGACRKDWFSRGSADDRMIAHQAAAAAD